MAHTRLADCESRTRAREGLAISDRRSAISGCLHREADLHVVADKESAGLERGIPVQAVVLPVDRDLALEGDLLVAPRIFSRAEVRHRQDDVLRDAAYRE